MAFLPSGMLAISTSTLARASTSAEADMVFKNSVTVDLATEAERTPMVPIMKYERVRVDDGSVRYAE